MPFDKRFVRTLDALSLLARKVRSGENRADRLSPRRGGSIEFRDYRHYTPGDEIRYIDWNVYARHHHLFVKEFSAEESVHVSILLDASRSMAYGDPSKFDAARELAAAFAYIGLGSFDTVSLYSYGREIHTHRKFLRGRNRIFDVLADLDRLSATETSDFQAAFGGALPRLKGRSLVLLLSDFYDPEGIPAAIKSLRSQRFEIHLVHLVCLEELQPRVRGRYSLVDLETNRRRDVTLHPQTVERYRKRFESYCRELERTAREQEVSYVRVRSDHPLERRVVDIVRSGGILEYR